MVVESWDVGVVGIRRSACFPKTPQRPSTCVSLRAALKRTTALDYLRVSTSTPNNGLTRCLLMHVIKNLRSNSTVFELARDGTLCHLLQLRRSNFLGAAGSMAYDTNPAMSLIGSAHARLIRARISDMSHSSPHVFVPPTQSSGAGSRPAQRTDPPMISRRAHSVQCGISTRAAFQPSEKRTTPMPRLPVTDQWKQLALLSPQSGGACLASYVQQGKLPMGIETLPCTQRALMSRPRRPPQRRLWLRQPPQQPPRELPARPPRAL